MGTALQFRRLGSLTRLGERSLFTCSCVYANRNGTSSVAFKHSRILKKLMTGSSHSRKKLYTVDQPPSKYLTEFGLLSGKTVGVTSKKSNKSLRRVQVLNTLFMEQITGLMATGEVSAELVGKGITVSEVKVSSDFSKVNVYWVATGTEMDEVIEPLLSKAGGKLRHELSQLRVIGIVPPIEFIKDKTFSKIMEVQTLLGKCDFGDDFVPTAPKNYFSHSSPATAKSVSRKFDVAADFSDKDKLEVEAAEAESSNCTIGQPPTTENDLYKNVSMRQDILGVRHDVILAEVKQMMSKIMAKKTQTLSREEKEGEFESLQGSEDSHTLSTPGSSMSVVDIATVQVAFDKQRKDEFLKYLRDQQIARAKELKRNSTSVKEKEFYDTEAFQRWKAVMEDSLEDKFDDHYDDELHEDFPAEYYSRIEFEKEETV